MFKELVEISANNLLAKDTVELVLKNKRIAESAMPGQFLYIQLPYHTLRRPISIASANKTAGTVTILFKVIGEGTALLGEAETGTFFDVIGPTGHGFPVDELNPSSPVLLIGGGIGVPPIYYLAEELNKSGIATKAILGFQDKDYVFYEEKFREISETIIVTNDGSLGKKGFVTDWTDTVGEFQSYYACGPMPMLKAVKTSLSEFDGYLSFEERMGCGVGTCYACVIPTNDEAGYKKICQDGPVFQASEVNL